MFPHLPLANSGKSQYINDDLLNRRFNERPMVQPLQRNHELLNNRQSLINYQPLKLAGGMNSMNNYVLALPAPINIDLPRSGVKQQADQHDNDGGSSSQRAKPRLKWTEQLHDKFVNIVEELGGASEAKPKAIKRKMEEDSLSLYQIKSYLQKYRLAKVRKDMGGRNVGTSKLEDGAKQSNLTPEIREQMKEIVATKIQKVEALRDDQSATSSSTLMSGILSTAVADPNHVPSPAEIGNMASP